MLIFTFILVKKNSEIPGELRLFQQVNILIFNFPQIFLYLNCLFQHMKCID